MRKLFKAQGLLAALLLAIASPAFSQGVFTAGDLWDTFQFGGNEPNARTYYGENGSSANTLYNLVRIGNLDRQWTSPTLTYPAGENIHLPWGQDLEMIEYNPDANFNTFTTSSNPKANNYAFGVWTPGVGAATIDQAAHYVDPNKRHNMIYEGTTPTTLGVTTKFRLQQWTINHANMNDFIVMELELTNTGRLDVDGDGNPEKTDNKINALTLNFRNEPINSMSNNAAGRRGASGWFTGVISGYDATPKANGNPWNVPLIFSGPTPSRLDGNGWAPDGSRELGVTMNRRKVYYDTYNGFRWIAAKKGPMNPSGSTVASEDKETIFDSPAVGEGAQAGWFSSVLKDYGGRDAQEHHNLAMGTFFANGGRTYDRASLDLGPDPNWFDPSTPGVTAGDPLSFVAAVRPEGERNKPLGDMKFNGTYTQNWEKNNPDPADDWTEGYSITHAFDGDLMVGIGPLSLEVGETVTLTFVEYAGFRLQGVRNASEAAQWAFDNNWNVPEPPPTPDVSVQPNINQKIDIKWDARAESAADFAGYKIYRSSAFPTINSLETGPRILDNYHTQTVEQPTDTQLAALGKPNNPNISSSAYKNQDPGAWGPSKLVTNISASEWGSYLNSGSDSGDYRYSYEDPSDLVAFGFKYWYYVAAYDNESGEIAGKPYTTLETHRNNFNGSNGLWNGTYHYATAAGAFPTTLAGLKNIGAEFVLKAPLVNATDLASGVLKVRVSPNPYKQQALHDTGTEHKMLFTNLATGTKITILDVSGQVVDVLRFDGTNPFDGTLFWDMFSKDGIEVTSGLYIFVAEYPGGTPQTGHFAILR